MLRTTSIALLALSIGCADDSEPVLKDGPTVGSTCSGGTKATLSEVPKGNAAAYIKAYADLRGSKTRITLLPPGNLTTTQCELSWQGTGNELSWMITVQAQQLGTFDAMTDEVRVWTADDESATGTVTLDGYNAEAGSLCGSIDATMVSGGRMRGTFIADVFCE